MAFKDPILCPVHRLAHARDRLEAAREDYANSDATDFATCARYRRHIADLQAEVLAAERAVKFRNSVPAPAAPIDTLNV